MGVFQDKGRDGSWIHRILDAAPRKEVSGASIGEAHLDGDDFLHGVSLRVNAARGSNLKLVPQQPKAGWFGVRCIFEVAEGTPKSYEERITVWRADSDDHAIEMAEEEAAEYASAIDATYLGIAQSYWIVGNEVSQGTEVFSLIRDSDLDPATYVDTFFDTGTEYQRDWVDRSATAGPTQMAESDVETMIIDVLAPDVREIWTFEAASYTAFADGRLDVTFADGSIKCFEVEDWMDVRPHGDWRTNYETE